MTSSLSVQNFESIGLQPSGVAPPNIVFNVLQGINSDSIKIVATFGNLVYLLNTAVPNNNPSDLTINFIDVASLSDNQFFLFFKFFIISNSILTINFQINGVTLATTTLNRNSSDNLIEILLNQTTIFVQNPINDAPTDGIIYGRQDSNWVAAGGGTTEVYSFNTRTGAVVSQTGDYSMSQISGTATITQGGTGQTTQQTAINALAGNVTSGQYLRGNGTNVIMSAIQTADVPILNQNTTGSAGSFTGNLVGDVSGTQITTSVKKINGVTLSTLSTGLLKNTTGTGAPTIAISGVDYVIPSGNITGTASNITATTNTTLTSLPNLDLTNIVNNTILPNLLYRVNLAFDKTDFHPDTIELSLKSEYFVNIDFNFVSQEFFNGEVINNVYDLNFFTEALSNQEIVKVEINLNVRTVCNFLFNIQLQNNSNVPSITFPVQERIYQTLFLEIGQNVLRLSEFQNADILYTNQENYWDSIMNYTQNLNEISRYTGKFCGYWNKNFQSLTYDLNSNNPKEMCKLLFNTDLSKNKLFFGGENVYRNGTDIRIKGLAYFVEDGNHLNESFFRYPFYYFGANVLIDNPSSIIDINNPTFAISPGNENLFVINVGSFQMNNPTLSDYYQNGLLLNFDNALKTNTVANSDFSAFDVILRDNDDRYCKIGVLNNEIISFQDRFPQTQNPVEENYFSFQVISSPKLCRTQNKNWLLNKWMEDNVTMTGNPNTDRQEGQYNFDGDLSGSNVNLRSEQFTNRASLNVAPALVPYTFVYDLTQLQNVNYTDPNGGGSITVSGSTIRDLMIQITNNFGVPFRPNSSTPIIFPNILRVYNWESDLSNKVYLNDIIYGNRFDLTINGNIQPLDFNATKHTYSSKAYMAQQSNGDTRFLVPVSLMNNQTNNAGERFYDIDTINDNKKYAVL